MKKRHHETAQLLGLTGVSAAYGAGQKLVSVALEYSEALTGDELSAEDYEVEGYSLVAVCTCDTIRGEASNTGRFVHLLLDNTGKETDLCEHIGQGPGARLHVRKPVLTVTQKRELTACSGKPVPPFARKRTENIDLGIAERFLTASFTTPAGRTLGYNLYIPEQLVPGQVYPIVLFMHDAGSCSDDPRAPLVQGTGATVWAIESHYNRRPCFVLAPHYPNVCANDDFEVTWEAEATVALMDELCREYPIDRRRIYGTGQSMGCMMLCELLLRHPGYFAGCLLVAGQWDPSRMAAARDENLWTVISMGDEKAFPIMRECLRNMRKAGGTYCESHVDARADAAWLDAAIRSQKARNANLNLTWFEGRSVVPDGLPVHSGMHHICTWRKAYDIKALREWLFEQRLCR